MRWNYDISRVTRLIKGNANGLPKRLQVHGELRQVNPLDLDCHRIKVMPKKYVTLPKSSIDSKTSGLCDTLDVWLSAFRVVSAWHCHFCRITLGQEESTNNSRNSGAIPTANFGLKSWFQRNWHLSITWRTQWASGKLTPWMGKIEENQLRGLSNPVGGRLNFPMQNPDSAGIWQ